MKRQYPLPLRTSNTPTLTLPVPTLTRKGNQQAAIEDLCKLMRRRYDEPEIEEVVEAYRVAEEGHIGQARISGEPYILHPVAVASIVFEMNMDHRSVMAALLHDVVEDTSISLQQIESRFGEDVAAIVDGLSKLTHLKFKSKAEAQAANFQKMLLAMVDDIRVILIKLADRIHNMRTLGVMPDEKRRRIARETLEVYAPIANRLGIYQMKNELEDLGFKSLYPVRYRVLKQAVARRNKDRLELVRKFEIKALSKLEDRGIDAKVHGREKHLYSLYQKMRNKQSAFEDVFDMFAVRVIVQSEDDCYRALGVMHSVHNPLPKLVKDYIAIPKSNGYQSLHTVLFSPAAIPIEVQIRTEEMNTFAETGVAAHWMYKEGQSNSAQQRAHLWLANLLDMQQTSADTLEFYENVKVDLFPYEIFVFSPMGDIYRLPQGATPVDFAYAVHSDIGNCCRTAKIDRQLAPLSAQLESGQTVEIICADDQQPDPFWLNFVVTPKARNSIRNFLKSQSRSKTIEFGRQMLARGLKRQHRRLEDIDPQSLATLLTQMSLQDLDDLCYEIGLGNHIPSVVAAWLVNEGDPTLEVDLPAQGLSVADPGPLVVEGGEDAIISLARCCMPIPGDNIHGMITAGKGVLVHRANCQNVSKQRRKAREWVSVVWGADIKGPFKTKIEVEINDVPGALAKVANVMSEMDTNIEDIRFEPSSEKKTKLIFQLAVPDRVQLGRLIKRVKSVEATLLARRV